VALESFAARVPVVVSDTGGLPEVVEHNRTGIVTRANDPDSLTWGILQVLQNPEYSQQLVEQAYNSIAERFSWDDLAKQTCGVYLHIAHERSQVVW
jgi:glycosyltransferase involved in cell wall biosynthesis